MKGKMKKRVIIVMVIIGAFWLYTRIWQGVVSKQYDRYEKSVENIVQEETRYTLGVHRPVYLGYTGNLYICENINFAEVENSYVDLLIWPGILKKDEIGVAITYQDSEENMVEVDMYLDDRFEPVEKTEENMELYRKNKEKILSMIQMAEDIWGDCK